MKTLKELAAEYFAAKKEEDAAVERRRTIGAQIAALANEDGISEGSTTAKVEGYKVSVTYTVNRKVDAPKVQQEWMNLPHYLRDLFRWKADVIVPEWRKLDQDQLVEASKYVTSKPGSPSVTVTAE